MSDTPKPAQPSAEERAACIASCAEGGEHFDGRSTYEFAKDEILGAEQAAREPLEKEIKRCYDLIGLVTNRNEAETIRDLDYVKGLEREVERLRKPTNE